MLNESSADWYHLDIMDGRFVPNISFGPMIVEYFRKATTKVCDVHLMIEEPEKYAELFGHRNRCFIYAQFFLNQECILPHLSYNYIIKV